VLCHGYAEKDRSGNVMIAQDFELPAIKLNNDKVEVITTVNLNMIYLHNYLLFPISLIVLLVIRII
jgi:hypothetical protein